MRHAPLRARTLPDAGCACNPMLCPIHGVQAPAGQVRPAPGEVHGHGRTRVSAGGNATDERARGRVEFGIVIFIDQAKDRAQGRSCREFERLAATGTLLVVGWLLVGCWLVGWLLLFLPRRALRVLLPCALSLQSSVLLQTYPAQHVHTLVLARYLPDAGCHSSRARS